MMKTQQTVATILAMTALINLGAAGGAAAKAGKYDGEAEFKKHCASCHADGGNIVKPDKTLSKKDMQKNGIKNAKDIVKVMRNPGPGMTAFDQKSLSDKEAKAIADYILKTFK